MLRCPYGMQGSQTRLACHRHGCQASMEVWQVSTLQLQQLRTRMFARVLGPFFVIVAGTTVARSDMRTLLSDFEANAAWPFMTGGFLLLASLVIVALHQYWRGAAGNHRVCGGLGPRATRGVSDGFSACLHGGRQRRDRHACLVDERRRLHRTRRTVFNLCRPGPHTEPGRGTSGSINPGPPARRVMYAQGSPRTEA